MNIELNGLRQQNRLALYAKGFSVRNLKDHLNTLYPGIFSIEMTLNDGEVLSPEIWETDKYDHITFEHYINNGLLDGGTIKIATHNQPHITPPVQPRTPPRPHVVDTREELINDIARYTIHSLNEFDFERIFRQGMYADFLNNFRTLAEFQQKQRQYLEAASMDKLMFYKNLLDQLNTIDFMDMEQASPGASPSGFFLMPDGRINLVAPR